MKLSARNKLPATVTAITEGAATANVELDCNGSGSWPPSPRRRPTSSGLKEGSEVTAFVKASDAYLGVAD